MVDLHAPFGGKATTFGPLAALYRPSVEEPGSSDVRLNCDRRGVCLYTKCALSPENLAKREVLVLDTMSTNPLSVPTALAPARRS